jgi:CpeT/CpcT family (DUF1001)
MNRLKAYILTVFVSTLTYAQKSYAVIAPSFSEAKQAAKWFTGVFDNTDQVASNSSVPAISMSNCAIQLEGSDNTDETQNVYLEQKSTAFERVRFYSFSPIDSAVKLSIRSFVNNNILSGLCNRPESERIVNTSNLVATSCDLLLMLASNRYVGSNAPNGCPTSSGGKVVSQVAIAENVINSLDQVFNPQGTLLVNTPIEFKRLQTIPESSYTFGLLAFGILGVNSLLKKKQ